MRSASDWRLLVAASAIQVATKCALSVMSLARLRRLSVRLRPIVKAMLHGPDDRVIWAIEATGRRLAGVSTCLVRALIAEWCLSTPDRPLRLTIGVKHEGRLEAHAWLHDRDAILMGGAIAHEYVPILTWDRLPA